MQLVFATCAWVRLHPNACQLEVGMTRWHGIGDRDIFHFFKPRAKGRFSISTDEIEEAGNSIQADFAFLYMKGEVPAVLTEMMSSCIGHVVVGGRR